MLEVVKGTASQVTIPFTVGGGISSVEDMRGILRAGADKISINSSAVNNPDLISQGAKVFGSQCIVVAIDARYEASWGSWQVYTHGGRRPSGLDVVEWAKQAVSLGAGEILLTSMDCDGQKKGFDVALTSIVSQKVNVPVIASGGAGSKENFLQAFNKGKADAALAASIFHYKETSIREIKKYLMEKGVSIRWDN